MLQNESDALEERKKQLADEVLRLERVQYTRLGPVCVISDYKAVTRDLLDGLRPHYRVWLLVTQSLFSTSSTLID